MTDFFDYAERYSLALFPCAAGTKRPILPWKKESSPERKQWVRWIADFRSSIASAAESSIDAPPNAPSANQCRERCQPAR